MNIGYYNEVQLKFIIKMQKKNSSTSGGLRPQILSCPLFVFPRCALADDGNVSATKLSHAAGD